jgi:hypothetical protein
VRLELRTATPADLGHEAALDHAVGHPVAHPAPAVEYWPVRRVVASPSGDVPGRRPGGNRCARPAARRVGFRAGHAVNPLQRGRIALSLARADISLKGKREDVGSDDSPRATLIAD